MVVTTKVIMDLLKPGFPSVIYAVQGDQNTRCLEMLLYSGGAQWDIPEGVAVSVRYIKPDGTKGYYDTMPDGVSASRIDGNAISVLLAPQMMTVSGNISAQLELIQGSLTVKTFSFVLHVEPDPAAGAVKSEDYINWVQWMKDEVERSVQSLLENGNLQGDPGPQGPPGESAVLMNCSVTYQASSSGTEAPVGDWLPAIPVVTEGNYLWTRTVYTFNTGEPVTQYSVSRFGLDGSGAVSSVAGISPDPTGNVPLKASDVGAVSRTGDNMEGPLNMDGQALSGLNAPMGLTEPVTLGYAEVNYHNYENRIDNSDFTRFVAQAGIGGAHAVGTKYAGDRWILDSGTATGTANSNGEGYRNITLNGTIRQIIANPPAVGTVFVEMASGTAEATYENGEVTVTSAGGVIKNIALYEGEFEEDTRPVYQPKGYAAEWTECLRYFLKPDPNNWNFAFTAANGTYLTFEIPCPVKMRVLPSIVSQGTLKLYAGGGWITVTVSSWTRYFHGGKYSMFASKASVSGIDISTAASYMMTGTPALCADFPEE